MQCSFPTEWTSTKKLAPRETYEIGMLIEQQSISYYSTHRKQIIITTLVNNNPCFSWDPKWTEVLDPALLLRIPKWEVYPLEKKNQPIALKGNNNKKKEYSKNHIKGELTRIFYIKLSCLQSDNWSSLGNIKDLLDLILPRCKIHPKEGLLSLCSFSCTSVPDILGDCFGTGKKLHYIKTPGIPVSPSMVPGALTESNFSVLGKKEVNSLYKKTPLTKMLFQLYYI